METIRDTADAREWQDAVKHLLVDEVRARANTAMEGQRGYLDQVHASIELFQKNPDLIPGGKDFNVALANRFAEAAKPYEIRDDKGKLTGYAIPVQPMIDQLRKQATAPPAKKAAPKPAAKEEPPQAGITSKAGRSGETQDFSTLFGTLGIPEFKI